MTELPDNFTLEFDLLVAPDFNAGFPLNTSIVQLADAKKPAGWQSSPNIFTFTAHPATSSGGTSSVVTQQDGTKGESYGSLKEIATVLTENADVKVQIVGHTDADGDDAANLDLSRRRAASVKAALANEFKIDAGRLDTDDKGETQPIDKNDTAAGKANNRRVEFIRK